MSKVKTKKRSLHTDFELRKMVKKLAEHALAILDSEERFLKHYPEYLERIRKEEESQKRDPLADAW